MKADAAKPRPNFSRSSPLRTSLSTSVPLEPSEERDPGFSTFGWRQQLKCFLIHTNGKTHEIIRDNLHRAPMYNGDISATGPRYCPSIEAKIVRFAGKESHQLFLEPEGWHTDEIYVQGRIPVCPWMFKKRCCGPIPALKQAELARPGYAIEYDYIPGTQVLPTLETKLLKGLFLAGQIVGTTGYEEAASLGIMAGINAARSRQGLRSRRTQTGIKRTSACSSTISSPKS